ncbi:hypothetical protein MIR68_003685 [Amoeboaphelidium protococcarum]|nr:hypothetical protein MIR68_003685 [Amoeboaphelidium protococcarum]
MSFNIDYRTLIQSLLGVEKQLSIIDKCKVATDLKELVESQGGTSGGSSQSSSSSSNVGSVGSSVAIDWMQFLTAYVPICSQLLVQSDGDLYVPVEFTSDSVSHRLRITLIEILQRVPYGILLQTHSAQYQQQQLLLQQQQQPASDQAGAVSNSIGNALEDLKSVVSDVMKVVIGVLELDNEEVGQVCLRIIIELHKCFRSSVMPQDQQQPQQQFMLEDWIDPFFQFVKDMLGNFQSFVEEYIDQVGGEEQASQSHSGSQSSLDEHGAEAKKTYVLGKKSFKLLSECPIILVLLIQIYKKSVASGIPSMVPLIISAISTRSQQQSQYTSIEHLTACLQAGTLSELKLGPCPALKRSAAFADFISSQVKIMSFLAYIIRGFSVLLKPSQQVIADGVMSLLLDCPPECSSARKELLVAARHILSTDFRASFVQYVDMLLIEDVLVGTSITTRESLRPLAYSTLADLIHHVRAELSREQIRRTVELYLANMHDLSLGASIQTMCAKLLLNLIDVINADNNNQQQLLNAQKSQGGSFGSDDGDSMGIGDYGSPRWMLSIILDGFCKKFTALSFIVDKLQSAKSMPKNNNVQLDLEHVCQIKVSMVHNESQSSEIGKDFKFLFKTLVLGVKTIISGFKKLQGGQTEQQQQLNPERVVPLQDQHIFVQLFADGLKCFQLYRVDSQDIDAQSGSIQNMAGQQASSSGKSIIIAKEEKEILEHFVSIFSLLDPALFYEVLHLSIGHFYDSLLKEPAFLAVPQYLLASEPVSRIFSGVLLQFLMGKLDDLGKCDTSEANMLLRLFKLAFMAVTLFPDSNEPVLQPHIHDLLNKCMKLSLSLKDNNSYFMLLRALFRNIGGGRFETLYKEVLPLLPMLLKGLNGMLEESDRASQKELFVELCLTVPVRLSVLLPYLHFLMKPLVLSLQASTDLVSQGLRTLELCVDNLTSDFLDPILAPVIKELMHALWSHLKPHPYHPVHSYSALRILGKLGGRSRKVLADTFELQPKPSSAVQLKLPLQLSSSSDGKQEPVCWISIAETITYAAGLLNDSKAEVVADAFKVCNGVVNFVLKVDQQSTDAFKDVLYQQFQKGTKQLDQETCIRKINAFFENQSRLGQDPGRPTLESISCMQSTLIQAMNGVFSGVCVEAIQDQCQQSLQLYTRHFALLLVAESLTVSSKTLQSQSEVNYAIIDPGVYLESLMFAVCSLNSSVRQFALDQINLLYSVQRDIVGDGNVVKLPVYHQLAQKLCSKCYQDGFSHKVGAIHGLQYLFDMLKDHRIWVLDHLMEVYKAVIFVAKDSSQENLESIVGNIESLLHGLLQCCFAVLAEGDKLKKQQSKFNSILGVAITELSNASSVVRKLAQDSLKGLTCFPLVQSDNVVDLLSPVKSKILGPIFVKPLRALPFSMQIGNLSAVSYCLELDQSLVPFNEEFIRLVQECIASADSDDVALSSKSSTAKSADVLRQLRFVCVKLLSLAVKFEEFSKMEQLNPVKFRIVQVFFKSLYSKSLEIVEHAKVGLDNVLIAHQNKLPKEILQSGLRPILVNLSDPKRLTPESLIGLARLLEKLSSYFKVEIGKKLLDHLEQWTNPQLLTQLAWMPSCQAVEIQVVVGVMDLMHLLPPAASCYLDDMVKKTLDLQKSFQRCESSPFLPPLLKFLNKYSQESVNYFLNKLDDIQYGLLFLQVLKHADASEVRLKLAEQLPGIIETVFGQQTGVGGVSYVQCLLLKMISVLLSYDPQLLLDQQSLQHLMAHWQYNQDSTPFADSRLGFMSVYHWNTLCQILHHHWNKYEDNLLLYQVSQLFAKQSFVCNNEVKRHFWSQVKDMAVEQRSALVMTFIDLLPVEKHKILPFLKVFVVPMLEISLADGLGESVLTEQVLSALHQFIWSQSVPGYLSFNDSLLILQFMQITASILNYCPTMIGNMRKDVIRSAWNIIKNEDAVLKFSSYVVICLFLKSFEVPEKMLLQILRSLLRTYSSESKYLVRQALEILLPILPKRLAEEGDSPSFVRWPRKILLEESHVLPQVISLWQIIIAFPEIYYDYRQQFVPMIVQNLPKLGLTSSSTMDTRGLCLDMIELIHQWEVIRISGRQTETAGDGMDVDSWTLPLQLQDIVVNFLVRFLTSVQEPIQRKGWSGKIMKLTKSFSSMWPQSTVKLSFVEKFMAASELNDGNVQIVASLLEIVGYQVESKDEKQISGMMTSLCRIFELSLRSDHLLISDQLESLVGVICDKCPDSEASDDVVVEQEHIQDYALQFVNNLADVISENLNNGRAVFSCVTIIGGVIISQKMNLVQALASKLDTVLTKVLQKLTKEVTQNQSVAPQVSELVRKLFEQLLAFYDLVEDNNKRAILGLLNANSGRHLDQATQKALVQTLERWVASAEQSKLKDFALVSQQIAFNHSHWDLEHLNRWLGLVADLFQSSQVIHFAPQMENAFMLGLMSQNAKLRLRFMKVLDGKLPHFSFARLMFILGVQNWEFCSRQYWLPIAIDILLMRSSVALSHSSSVNVASYGMYRAVFGSPYVKDADDNCQLLAFSEFLQSLSVIYKNNEDISNQIWCQLFKFCWAMLSKSEVSSLNKVMIGFLTKPYHQMQKQLTGRNVVQSVLEGATQCQGLLLPPAVLRYLAQNYNFWYLAIELIQQMATQVKGQSQHFKNPNNVINGINLILQQLYGQLRDQDAQNGVWLVNSLFKETNAALSYEIVGDYKTAQSILEDAQMQVKNGSIPFVESELSLWEDKWIECGKQLQQWDLLNDLSKHENMVDLQLQCAWRITDWSAQHDSLQALLSSSGDDKNSQSEKQMYQSLALLSKLPELPEKLVEFQKSNEQSFQMVIAEWHQLPKTVTGNSHSKLLQEMQLMVEFQEASHIYAGANPQNPQVKLQSIQELKGTLGTWRDRLPNIYDGIDMWSKLVAWRQHVFGVINNAYQSPDTQNSLAYRGFHEIAWIINRFAHVARKQHLSDVCINALTKIYTLPNIEISDAFLKLREQAKCYMGDSDEYISGLEVISNTNLGYFQQPQRAEFFALKGEFLAKLDFEQEANAAFSSAIQIDANLPKGWLAWAQFNDTQFQSTKQISYAANAVNCYLHACELYNSRRCRKYIARILWLLSVDDATGTVQKAFDAYKGNMNIWYWITFIPQLLSSLSHQEASIAKAVLIKIVKAYPQAVYFQMRCHREEVTASSATTGSSSVSGAGAFRTLTASSSVASISNHPVATAINAGSSSQLQLSEDQANTSNDEIQGKLIGLQMSEPEDSSGEMNSQAMDIDGDGAASQQKSTAASSADDMDTLVQTGNKSPADQIDDIMAILKTAYPLLTLTMETMVDQILARLKPTADEEIHRILSALLSDAYTQLVNKIVDGQDTSLQPSNSIQKTILKFLQSPYVSTSKFKNDLERDLVQNGPSLEQIVVLCRQWVAKLDLVLGVKQRKLNLHQLSNYLAEFEYQKFDDVEVPGQYLNLLDAGESFVKIERLQSEVDVVKSGVGVWSRRIYFIGQDGNKYPFMIQNPSFKHSRREETLLQFMRMCNDVLGRKVESRKRELSLYTPKIVSLASSVRLVESDVSAISLQRIYDDYCEQKGYVKDEPCVQYLLHLQKYIQSDINSRQDLQNFYLEIFQTIQSNWVQNNLLSSCLMQRMKSYEDFWLLKRSVAKNLATSYCIQYMWAVSNRLPGKLNFGLTSGQIEWTDMMPHVNKQAQIASGESVPFRLTPQLQNFIGPELMAGVFVSSMLSAAFSLSLPEYDMSQLLPLFVRDELLYWQKYQPGGGVVFKDAQELAVKVEENVNAMVTRLEELAAKEMRCSKAPDAGEADQQQQDSKPPTKPLTLPITKKISEATNPNNLVLMGPLYHPWL